MRIGYWTTACLQPECEAVSKEVYQLAAQFSDSFIVGISEHYFFRASWKDRVLGFSNKFDPLLRVLIPLMERSCDINHVYGEPTPWTYYKSLRIKPLVLTIASEKGMPRSDFVMRCRKIIVQTSSYYQKLLEAGVEKGKLTLLYPGIDLRRFRPAEQATIRRDMPRILFASAPRSREELEQRGVYLLLDAAAMSSEARYHLLYREWDSGYTSLEATKQYLRRKRLRNVTVTNAVIRDMHRVYPNYDLTVIPFTVAEGGKECPTSALEGLACGVPALISSAVPFAEFIANHSCGVVFDPTPANLVKAIEVALRRYPELSKNAVNAARHYFDAQLFFQRVNRLYGEILS
jgi:glycosyltransferase involved in cell wall biosynthesis